VAELSGWLGAGGQKASSVQRPAVGFGTARRGVDWLSHRGSLLSRALSLVCEAADREHYILLNYFGAAFGPLVKVDQRARGTPCTHCVDCVPALHCLVVWSINRVQVH
jgi:hypothetical protein